MTLIQIVVLALIQGLTEFLPVSSSAHLILGSVVFGWPDQGLVFDVATHLGTLLAVLVYFRRDWLDMAGACLSPARSAADHQHRRMAILLVLASLPALVIGGLAPDFVEKYLRDVAVLAWATVGFGILLGVADLVSPKLRDIESVGLRDALVIGLAQACALVPGVSRSGITITAGRFLGLSPEAAAPIWKKTVGFADSANEPGKFTAFCSYEWTSQYNNRNLHRNVFFRDCEVHS